VSTAARHPLTEVRSPGILADSAERLAAVILSVVLLPVILVTAGLIVVLSFRSPLIGHRRCGRFGEPFWTWKFRTMWDHDRPGGRFRWVEYVVDEAGPERKSARDPRVRSRFARWCRRFSIDELPQLVNVIRGDMSFIGPRPLTRGELEKHYAGCLDEVLQVKPGITGLWQVQGRNRLTYGERRERDLYLVRNGSFRLYLEILLRTLPVVFRGEDCW
jgi:exopolysaccharide production protein ExoY